MTDSPKILPAGDSAVLVEFGEVIDPDVNSRVYALFDSVEKSLGDKVIEMIPTYRSLLVVYNPIEITIGEMSDQVGGLLDGIQGESDSSVTREIIELPVVYGGEDGPDLYHVAEHAGISPQEVIDIHSGTGYLVYMIGFAPGFPYLGGLDERIACPRLTTPRVKVPAGSVGIAESQTGVYPNASPGGWQLIGRTAVPLFDVQRENPSLIKPGAEVRFVPVDSHD
ncbi:MAG: 5-oxoprolinase subunit PxpB [Dehalococcoidia bacterium]